MSFCPQCGKLVKETEKFCAHCGENLKELSESSEEEAPINSKKKASKKVTRTDRNRKSSFKFFLFIIILGYLLLDIWGISQITPEISTNSLLTSVSNMKGNVGLTSASASTKIRFMNPTPVPVFLFPISYELAYGSTKIAWGKSGIIFIMPYSSSDVSVDMEISYLGAVSTIISNIYKLNNAELHVDFFELGIKFASVS